MKIEREEQDSINGQKGMKCTFKCSYFDIKNYKEFRVIINLLIYFLFQIFKFQFRDLL